MQENPDAKGEVVGESVRTAGVYRYAKGCGIWE
jgi:hypothetical protein